MKIKTLFIIVTGLAVLLNIVGCKRKGCTDSNATNFDPRAKKDDGTCYISGCRDPKADNYMQDATKDCECCNYTAQGPGNASFETAGASSVEAYGWVGYGTQANNFGPIPCWSRLTGTGFMPTNGIYYMQISPGYDFYSSALDAGIYKDNVFLNHVTGLTFDYSYGSSGTNGTGLLSDSILTGTINFLFTSNGTTTLWTKTISSVPAAYGVGATISTFQKQNESIVLPVLPDKGRFTIQVKLSVIHNAIPAGFSGPSLAGSRKFNFQVDNIKVN